MSSAPTKWLDRRIARQGPYLCLVLSAQEHDRVLAKFGSIGRSAFPKAGARIDSLANANGDTVCIVMLSESAQEAPPTQIAALLVHEASHACDYYFDDIGEKNPASEQKAYAIQAVSQELFEEYARRLKAKAKKAK